MEPIPLYRNLLRQASILYDDVARDYIARAIKHQFRKKRDVIDEFRLHELLREGQQRLSLLKRANTGEPKPLQRVLELAYGRVGRRRHEFLRPILAAAQHPEPIIPGVPRSAPPVTSDELVALMKHQVGTTIARAEPEIPKTNAWGLPFPKCREVNKRRRHRNYVLQRLLAPMPQELLGRLDRMARGEESPTPPKRRIKPQCSITGRDSQYNVTTRFKKRAWKKILAKTPVLVFNEKSQKPVASWPEIIVKGAPIKVGTLGDFEGFIKPEVKQTGKKKSKKRDGEGEGEGEGEGREGGGGGSGI